MNYQAMNTHNDDRMKDVDSDLLRLIVSSLSSAQKRKITKELERQRAHFAHSTTPGHYLWYGTKLAMCARFEALS